MPEGRHSLDAMRDWVVGEAAAAARQGLGLGDVALEVAPRLLPGKASELKPGPKPKPKPEP